MKISLITIALVLLGMESIKAQKMLNNGSVNYSVLKTESHIAGLTIALLHQAPEVISKDYPILFLHGSSFPSALAFGFRMNNYSWMDHLAENGYDVFALDFLGYGYADRYPKMKSNSFTGKLIGRAADVYLDVDRAVEFILKKTGKSKVYLIGHSWGGSVAALYAGRFSNKIEKLVLFATITKRNDTTTYNKVRLRYNSLTPEQRINAMQNLTPSDEACRLDKEVFEKWGKIWLQFERLSSKIKTDKVQFPSGPDQDIEDMTHNRSYYNPEDIKTPVLIIRGEWDNYPNDVDARNLFRELKNSPEKKYVIIEKGTHVMHLEKSRYRLYEEVLTFLK